MALQLLSVMMRQRGINKAIMVVVNQFIGLRHNIDQIDRLLRIFTNQILRTLSIFMGGYVKAKSAINIQDKAPF